MPDIFELLAADHREVESMFQEMDATSDADRRDALVEQLIIAESRHEAAEEMVFWPAVRSSVEGGDALAERGIGQEDEAKRILAQLDKAAPNEEAYGELMPEFTRAARAHIVFEEQQVWPELEAVLSVEERAELGEKFQHSEESGPTRPHPHGPSSEGGLKTVGAAAAVTDKVRDAVTRRGRE